MKATLKAGDAHSAISDVAAAISADMVKICAENEELVRLINNASTPDDLRSRAKSRLKVLETEAQNASAVSTRVISLGRQLGALPRYSVVELSAVEMVLFSYGAP